MGDELFDPRLDILPAAQQRLWPDLRAAQGFGMVLYGGTAIALQLGHRLSVDFDFFTDQPLDRMALKVAFPFIARSTVLQDQPETFTVLVDDAGGSANFVKVSFFGALQFGRVGAPLVTRDGVAQVAALDDLMATKVKVLLQRVEAKDYKDIAAMIDAGVSLASGLASARAMFGRQFQPSEALKALVYFEGGDLHSLTVQERQTLISAVSSVRELPAVTTRSRVLAAS